MPHLQSASLRPSLLALAIVSTLPGVTFAAADEITVTATGNARSAFEAPMMVSVIDATAPENQTASSAADLLRKVPGLTLDGTGRTNGQDVNLRGYDRRGRGCVRGDCENAHGRDPHDRGHAGGWGCGARRSWLAYTPSGETAKPIHDNALNVIM